MADDLAGCTHLTRLPLDAAPLLALSLTPEDGALVVFGGTVRRFNNGKEVRAITYSAYAPVAERRLWEIERESLEQCGARACLVRHRLGDLLIGDLSVLVVTRAQHRAEAFAAARHAIEAVKHSVPIWKREEYSDGTHSFVMGCALHEEHHI